MEGGTTSGGWDDMVVKVRNLENVEMERDWKRQMQEVGGKNLVRRKGDLLFVENEKNKGRNSKR